ncbi:MAG: hypothetical protein WCQ00_01650 [bacterium]
MSGKIQFDDEFNYRPKNTTRAGYSKTSKKSSNRAKLSFTQKLVKNGICKTERTAEKFLLTVAAISFTAGIIFAISILNPALKYRVLFTLEGKHILTDQEAQDYINHKIFDRSNTADTSTDQQNQ